MQFSSCNKGVDLSEIRPIPIISCRIDFRKAGMAGGRIEYWRTNVGKIGKF